MNGQNQPIPYSNLGEMDIYLLKSKLLGFLEACPIPPPNKASVYLNLPNLFDGKLLEDDAPDNIKDLPYLAHYPMDESVEQADVSDYWGAEFKDEIHELLRRRARLFRMELGMFNDSIDMPIPFKDEKDLSGLKQSAYNLTKRDQEAINEILDPLVTQGQVEKVPLGQLSATSSLAFIVWKNGKPRVVVDL